MIRGTTPPFILRVGCDLTGYDCYVTFEWFSGQFTKYGEDLTIDAGDQSTVTMKLTQAETLSFPENKTVKVQLRGIKDDDVIATKSATFTAGEVLLEKEIPLANG